ncbi:hypothetical protein QBC46DRAFT_26842 [Diplogelasinospora grovesii]|uniref:F-box domain-containing protein n=1 Tax=Diplogelasinospora grovesii TaxID=303347 RepID=A0AAN6S8E7_9PEZI|nr:hypothetical protein QBC46DRAFT_26842 [Diplogelasinospora grovesii]
MRDITELPRDIFLIIILNLPPRACLVCRSVSRQWFATFTSDDVSRVLLRFTAPRCRELRLEAAAKLLSSSSPSDLAILPNNVRVELKCIAQASHHNNWASIFAGVAQRYHNLRKAKHRAIEKLNTAGEGGGQFSFRGVATWNRFLRWEDDTDKFHYPDPAWWYSQEDGILVYPVEKTAAESGPARGYQYQIYDPCAGLYALVPFDVRQKHIRRVRLAQGVLIFEWAEELPYHQLNDREVVHRHFVTAFDVVRIPTTAFASPMAGKRGVLAGDGLWTWRVNFRSEWKLHFLGLPLNDSDRFFSAHTATHYAVYFWQPNRSLYNDDPIEQLAVWDISSSSPYRPSEDQLKKDGSGSKRPTAGDRTLSTTTPTGLWNGANGNSTPIPTDTATTTTTTTTAADSSSTVLSNEISSLAAATAGPQVIRRMAWSELDFYGLRQRDKPSLRNLALDDHNLYVVEEEHRWANGQHSSMSPPRAHMVRCTGIPIVPFSCHYSFPPHENPSVNGEGLLSSLGGIGEPEEPKPNNDTSPAVVSTIIDGPVYGPAWVDSCGGDRDDVNMSFCRRVFDCGAAVGFSPRRYTPQEIAEAERFQGPLGMSVWEWKKIAALRWNRLAEGAWPWTTVDSAKCSLPTPAADPLTLHALLLRGWPVRWAPCWRHEDFPHLTVAEMADFAAGVRIAARHLFWMAHMSVFVRPNKITVRRRPPPVGPTATEPTMDKEGSGSSSTVANNNNSNDDDDDDILPCRHPKPVKSPKCAKCGTGFGWICEQCRTGVDLLQDVDFPNASFWWDELLAKGHISGDERWVIGEDKKGRITIVRF